jgi:hypothetical protein
LGELLSMLDSGCFRVTVPEQATLLVVALLASNGRSDEAYDLLSIIEPWMDRLRFYPEPSETPLPLAATVHLESVGQVVDRLNRIEDQARILAQKETLNIWLPLHDEFVRLVVDSCQFSEVESVESLGEPFTHCDEHWHRRAANLLRRYAERRRVHYRSGKPERRGEVFFELRRLVRKRVELADGTSLPESDVNRAREMLRRDYAKRGPLNSERRHSLRGAQARDGKVPTRAQAAKIVCDRLKRFDPDAGIEQPEVVVETALDDVERANLFGSFTDSNPPFAFAKSIERKVMRCREASVDELVKTGLVTSGDVLAQLIPQIAGRAMSWRFEDNRTRQLFLQTYRAFRARRSLLLLHLQKQVQFEELP